MNQDVFISVAIPNYNRFEELVKAVDSIYLEKYEDVEVVIVDDCSKVDVWEKIKNHFSENKKIKLYRNEVNLGLTPNWNKSVSLCLGEWVTLLCSDDYFVDGGFEKTYNLLKNSEKPMLVIQNKDLKNGNQLLEPGAETIKKMSMPIASGNFWHKECIRELGLFDEKIKYSPDGEYWFRLATKFPVLIYQGEFAHHYLHRDNYMWETWLKDDFVAQLVFITKMVSEYKNEVQNLNMDEFEWGCYKFFIGCSIGKDDQKKVFEKYWKLFKEKANSIERKKALYKMYMLYVFRKFIPSVIKEKIKGLMGV